MTNTLMETLIPNYIKEFTCIGSSCEDTCCSGWRVNIDEGTYKKYKKIKDPLIKERVRKDTIRNRSNPDKNNVAKMKMNHGNCSFLSNDGLCEIQLMLGEDFLCDTCAIYPRRTNKVNGIVEQSLTVSCPEAARLILLNENGIEFENGHEKISFRGFTSIFHSNTEKITHWKDLYNEYRYITILILQNRTYSLEDRLLILAMLFNELEECVNKGEINEIPNILGQYLKGLEDNIFEGVKNNISERIDIQIQLCRDLLVLRLSQSITSSRYLECSREMMSGLKMEGDSSNKEIEEAYKISYNQYYAPFMEKQGYMLENYLVNYVFKNCMPIDSTSPFESFSSLILHYSLIKLHLVGMASHYNGLNSDLVIKLIQSLSKTFEHNPVYLEKTMGLLKEKQLMNLTYASILIGN